jgi:hypothetical protein
MVELFPFHYPAISVLEFYISLCHPMLNRYIYIYQTAEVTFVLPFLLMLKLLFFEYALTEIFVSFLIMRNTRLRALIRKLSL